MAEKRVAESRGEAEIPIACSLSEEELEQRGGDIAEIIAGVEHTVELADGYELSFPGSGDWAEKIARFAVNERSCCSFFRLEIVFEPGQGPVLLRLRGSGGVKEFIRMMAGG